MPHSQACGDHQASQETHVCGHCTQVPVTFIYGEHDWMNPAAGVAVAEVLDKIRERKVSKTLIQCLLGVGEVFGTCIGVAVLHAQ